MTTRRSDGDTDVDFYGVFKNCHEAEAALIEHFHDMAMSGDPQIALAGRAGKAVFVPFVRWLSDEFDRAASSDADESNIIALMPGLLANMMIQPAAIAGIEFPRRMQQTIITMFAEQLRDKTKTATYNRMRGSK